MLRTAITGDVEGDFEALQRLFWQFDAASVGSLMIFVRVENNMLDISVFWSVTYTLASNFWDTCCSIHSYYVFLIRDNTYVGTDKCPAEQLRDQLSHFWHHQLTQVGHRSSQL